MKNIEQTQKIQEEENREKTKQKKNKKKKPNQHINYKEKELRKEGRESLVVSPQVRDQSRRVPLKEASI